MSQEAIETISSAIQQQNASLEEMASISDSLSNEVVKLEELVNLYVI